MEKSEKNPQKLTGVVKSNKMKDTIVVRVDRYVKHKKYEKFYTTTKNLKAHDPGNTKQVGDKVTIVACRPISKDKKFRVLN